MVDPKDVAQSVADLSLGRIGLDGREDRRHEVRVSAGGLIALKQELKGTSGIDLDDDDEIDELAELIIRVFFPGETAPRG